MSIIYINPYAFSAAWTPANITTTIWFDAADSSTITLVGSNVSQWNDKSGNGWNATQSTSGSRPVLTSSALNSRDVITFDGSNDHFVHSLNLSPAPHSVFVVGTRTSSVNSYMTAFSAIAANSAFGCVLSLRVDASANWGSYINSWVSAGTSALNSYLIMGIISPTSTSGTETYSTNGSLTTSSYAARYSGDAFNRRSIGGDPAFPAGFLEGSIAEIIAFNSALSTDNRQRIEGYLAHKWGLTANLPADHPYKTTGPTA